MNLNIADLQAAVIPSAEQMAKIREFVERVKAACREIAEKIKRIIEWIKKHFSKPEPPEDKKKARFWRKIREQMPHFNIAAYGRRHKPP